MDLNRFYFLILIPMLIFFLSFFIFFLFLNKYSIILFIEKGSSISNMVNNSIKFLSWRAFIPLNCLSCWWLGSIISYVNTKVDFFLFLHSYTTLSIYSSTLLDYYLILKPMMLFYLLKLFIILLQFKRFERSFQNRFINF